MAASGHAALARWSPWAPDAAALLVAAVTDLGNRASWRSAADALLALMAAAPDGTSEDNPLAWALAALVTADARTGMPDAEPDRDRPARQRIRHLATRLAQHGRMRPREMRRHALGAAELLAGYETFIPEAAQVLVQALDLDARPSALTAALARLARLHTSRPALAARTADVLRDRLDAASRPGGREALLRAAWQLEEDGGHAAGLFAAVLTGVGGPRTEWAEPWRERVRGLRRHPHPDVRDAALRLTTAGE
ncbi:translation initiation factor IF-2 [Streptomyces himastatinicus ATCC 53653]|uniref:Translation initiation factor IF-2 n=1 Tax=Streptomyces himastatinicus ATCC 53653 TaxID=457427 RepID=D9WSF2_9ACTN|nr:translation initiation factor IF-2 [Streptomyces himastatinicus ATCC 53653]